MSARFHFVAAGDAVLSPATVRTGDWSLVPAEPPSTKALGSPFLRTVPADRGPERYTPAYLDDLIQLPAWQVAFFRRNGAPLLAAAVDVYAALDTAAQRRIEATAAEKHWSHSLVAYVASGSHLRNDRSSDTLWADTLGTTMRQLLDVGSDTVLLGFEATSVSPDALGGATAAKAILLRIRGAAGRNVVGQESDMLSDILLCQVTNGEELSTLNDAYPRAYGSLTLPTGSPVGLYWELYDLGVGDSLRYALTVRPVADPSPGVLGFLGRFLRLTRHEDPVEIRWNASARGQARVLPQWLELKTEGLADGDYVLELSVTRNGGGLVTAKRDLSLRSTK